MIGIWIALFVLALAVTVLFFKYRQLYTKLPQMEKGDRIPIVKEGESNLTIIRKGADTLVSDEEGNLIPFKTSLE